MSIKTEIKNIFGKVRVWAELLKFPHKRLGGAKRTNLYNAALKSYLSDDKAVFNAVKALRIFPVTIEEFLTNKEYLGAVMDYWPETIQKLKDTLPDIWNEEIYQNKGCPEVTFTGRRGKTVLLTATFLYIWYIHTCFSKYDASRHFDLFVGSSSMRSSENLLNTIRTIVDRLPYFSGLHWRKMETGARNIRSSTIRLDRDYLLGTNPTACFLDDIREGSLLDDFINEVNIRFKIRDLTPPEILFPFTQAIYKATEYQH